MDSKTYSTKQVLQALNVPYYVFEYLIRTNQVRPVSEGRASGRERRFSEEELEKAKCLTQHSRSNASSSREEGRNDD